MSELTYRSRNNKPTIPAKQAAEAEANYRAARIILADRERYAGLQVEWAEAIVRKLSLVR